MNVEPIVAFSMDKKYEPKGITLTSSAVAHITAQLNLRRAADYNKGLGIRFGVTGAGCGGYSYTVAFVDEYAKANEMPDHIFKQDGVSIFVDQKSILMIDRMEVDFITEGFNSGLQFNNPLAGQACGCGESFTMA